MGARLVIHSFQLLIRNFADALKVSVFPIVVGVLLGIAAFSVSGITPEVIMMASVTGSLPPGGLLALLFGVLQADAGVLGAEEVLRRVEREDHVPKTGVPR